MMIDGVRQNFRFTGHEAQGFVYVDPALLAGIDIARGAVSTTGGAGALVGSANLRTLDVDDIIKPGKKTGVLTSAHLRHQRHRLAEMLAAGATHRRRRHRRRHQPSRARQLQERRRRHGAVHGPGPDVGPVQDRHQKPTEQSLKLGGVFYDNDFFANSLLPERQVEDLHRQVRLQAAQQSADRFHAQCVSPTRWRCTTSAASTRSRRRSAGRVIKDDGMGFDVTNTSRFTLGGVRRGVRPTATSTSRTTSTLQDAHAIGRRRQPGSARAASAACSRRRTFSYGIFDLITGLRYDHLHARGSLDRTRPANPRCAPPLPMGPFEHRSVRRPAQSQGDAGGTGDSRGCSPTCTYSESIPRADHHRDDCSAARHPGGRLRSSFFPNPFLKPEVQKGWEFGANIQAGRRVHAAATPSA